MQKVENIESKTFSLDKMILSGDTGKMHIQVGYILRKDSGDIKLHFKLLLA